MLEILGIALAVFGVAVLTEVLTAILVYTFYCKEEWHGGIKMDWGNVLIILIVILMIFGSAKNDVNKNRK